MKKRLTSDQEFQILKLVFDKFLWIGIVIMLFGFWQLVSSGDITSGISWIVAGAVVLLLMVILLIKHYEIST